MNYIMSIAKFPHTRRRKSMQPTMAISKRHMYEVYGNHATYIYVVNDSFGGHAGRSAAPHVISAPSKLPEIKRKVWNLA